MVDVISTRFQGMYGSWNYFNNNSAENMDRTKEKKQDRDDRHYKEEIQVGISNVNFATTAIDLEIHESFPAYFDFIFDWSKLEQFPRPPPIISVPRRQSVQIKGLTAGHHQPHAIDRHQPVLQNVFAGTECKSLIYLNPPWNNVR